MNNVWLKLLFTGLQTLTHSSHQPSSSGPASHAPKKPQNSVPPGGDWNLLATQEKGSNLVVYDPQGTPLNLRKADVVTHGGEGVIYRFAPNPNILIKVCKPETLVDAKKLALFRSRLAAMMRLRECREAPFLAWPLMPVMDAHRAPIGFVMRKCLGRTFRALFAPMQVQRFFPGWDRLHVTQVALNFLDAVRMLAKQKVLVNDFNPGNFLVDKTGRVRLIDCDSFQIPAGDGPPLMTRTFTPEFCAPELLLHPELFDKPRTPEQVRFSLAIVIYMILMSGLHPFARCGGGDPAENLKSGRCPLDKESGVRLPVSWHKSVSWLTPGLRDCFQQMFTMGFAHPEKRPLLGELRTEIETFITVMKTSKNNNQRAILPTTAKKGKKK